MDLLLDKRSKRLIIEHEKEDTASPPQSSEPPAIVIQAAENESEDIQPATSPKPVETVQGMIPVEVFEEQNSPESEQDTSAEIETIEMNQEIQEINIKTENISDDQPEENLQEVIHHKSGPIREEGPDYIIYRPERKKFEKTESGVFQCSDCPYTNSEYSLGRVQMDLDFSSDWPANQNQL